MRKIFTRLISIFILSTVFVIQGFAQVTIPTFTQESDATNAKKTDPVEFSISEEVVAGTGVVRLVEGTTTLAAYQASNGNVVFSVEKDDADKDVYLVSVDFSSYMMDATSYTVEFDADFVMSTADTPVGNAAASFGVATGDFTAPELADDPFIAPEDGAEDVALGTKLTLQFDEDVMAAVDAEIYVYTDNGTPNGDLYAVAVADATQPTNAARVRWVLPEALKGNTLYYVVIPEGAITDISDNKNKFAGWTDNSTWSFSTLDNVAPEVTSITADNITGNSMDIMLQLDKPGYASVLALVKGSAKPAEGAFDTPVEVEEAGKEVKFAVTGLTEAEGTEYDIWVYASQPDVNNYDDITKELTVATVDTQKPTVTAWYPANGTGAEVIEQDSLELTFNEKVVIGVGSVSVYTWSGDTNHELLVNVPAASCILAEDGMSLAIPVDNSLWVSEETYYVTYTDGLVADEAGNKLDGITTTEDWKFTIKDVLAPTYVVAPDDMIIDEPTKKPQITLTFDEMIYDGDGNAYDATTILNVITLKTGTTAVPFTVTVDNTVAGAVVALTITNKNINTPTLTLSVDNKKIYDVLENKGTEVDVIDFDVVDFTGPIITIEPLSPGETDNILVKFDEVVYNTDGSEITDADVADIVIFRKGADETGAIVAATYTAAADGMSWIIDPENDFGSEEDYFVKVGAGAVIDAAENANKEAAEAITVIDFVAPTATFSDNIKDSPVDPNALNPVITFDEQVVALDGSTFTDGDRADAYITVKMNGEVIPAVGNWQASGTQIRLSDVFGPGREYEISIGQSLQDVAENVFEGASATFYTWSEAAPVAETLTPDSLAVEQPKDAPITITFDQDINAVVAGSFTITDGTTPVTVTDVTKDGKVVTVKHADLPENAEITVNVAAGAVTNMASEPNVAFKWRFFTVDTQDPTGALLTSSPAAVDTDLEIKYNEKVAIDAGQIEIKGSNGVTVATLTEDNASLGDDEMTVTVSLTSDLDYNKAYYLVVTEGFVADLAGNPSVAVTSPTAMALTTVANAGAFVVDTSNPEDMEDNVAAGITPLTVDFERAIKDGSLSDTKKITLNDGTTNVISDVANSARFSISGTTLTINTLDDIVADKTYTLTLQAGIVTDEFGTPNDAATIVFHTMDAYAPMAEISPANGERDVAVDTDIVITWDETPEYDGATITAAGIKALGLVTVENGVAYTASISGNVWTLAMDADFAEMQDVDVVVNLAKIGDGNGNEHVGGTTTATFKTLDASVDAPSNWNEVAVTEDEVTFTIDFDEEGSVFYAVQMADEDAPTAADIIAMDNEIEFDGIVKTSDEEVYGGLVSDTEYYAYFAGVDTTGNISDVFRGGKIITVDVTSPVIVEMIPADDSVGVDKNTDLVLKFDEAVVAMATAKGIVSIREVATDVLAGAVIPVNTTTTTLTDEGKTATIDLGFNLGNETEYYVELTTGSFEDAAGNKVAGITGKEAWTFTTKDIVNPKLVMTYPKTDSIPTPEIPAGTALWFEMDEAVSVETGVVSIKYKADGKVFEVINSDALTVSEDMMTVSFDMANAPVEKTEFIVDLADLVVKDLAGNAWKAGNKPDGWIFAILDETPPALEASTPADGDDDAKIADDITLTFTEAIYSTSEKPFNGTDAKIEDVVSLVDADGEEVEAVITINGPDYDVVTINPKEDLMSETTYTVYVSPVIDDRGNVSDEITVTFMTADMTAPTAMWDPAFDTDMNPVTGVITVTFSEEVYKVLWTGDTPPKPVLIDINDEDVTDFFTYKVVTDTTRNAKGELTDWTTGADIVFTGSISADKMVMTLTPDEDDLPLASEAWYEVALLDGVVFDKVGLPNVADETVFGTEDTTNPVAEEFTPDGPTKADAEMTITFDEYVAVGAGSIYIRDILNGEVAEMITVSEATVTIDKNVATIAHADFPEATNFYVTADAGVFTDTSMNANPWEGIANDKIGVWNFSTADAVEPGIAVDGLNPAPEAINVALGIQLQMTFDKMVKIGTEGSVIIYNEDGTPYEIITDLTKLSVGNTTGGDIQYPNRMVTVANMELMPTSNYFVRVAPGTIVDEAGNEFAGIMDNTWSFATEDKEPPTIKALTPERDATLVDPRADLVIEFDRSVLPSNVGMIKLYKEQPGEEVGSLIETIDPTSASVVIDGALATIKLAAAMENETGYYVIVEPGSFTNTSSERLPLIPGIITTQGWAFTTGIGSPVGPEVVSLSPNMETLTDNHPTLVITFAEDVILGDAANVYVTEKDSTTAHLTIPITADMISGNIVTVTYEYDAAIGGLKLDTEYFVTVDSAAVKDVEGVLAWEGISSITEWTFTTGPEVATGIEDELTVDFKVYPNPFSDYIRIDNNEKLIRVVVSNIAGQRVIDVDYPENEIRTDNLVSGIYVVSLITEDGIAKTEKIIKK